MPKTLYTIGYATKPIDTFLAHLRQYRIDAIADIRSVPFSKRFYDYHQPAIFQHLEKQQIRYVYLGDELGPRSKDLSHYDAAGQVQYDLLAQSTLFASGIQRLTDGVNKGFRIALMCAEKDPATCHRGLLVGYDLVRRDDWTVVHISHNGDTETQQTLEARLSTLHPSESDLFLSATDQADLAYQKQRRRTSYRKA